MKHDSITTANKRSQILLVSFFGITLLLGLAGSFINRDAMPDFREQRAMASLSDIQNVHSISELPRSITQFVSDNFGFRKTLLSAYFNFRLNLLHADLNLPGLLGQEGWMFIDGEIPFYRHQNLLTAMQTEQIRNRLDSWCTYSHQHGAEFVFFVGPNKSTIYPEKIPSYIERFNGQPSVLDQVNALDYRCPFIHVDLRDTLKNEHDELLYYKWGTHWNDRGAQLAWYQIKNDVSAKVPNLIWPEVAATTSTRPARPLEDSMWQWFGQNDPYVVALPRIELTKLSRISTGAHHRGNMARTLAFGDSFLEFMFNTAGIVASDYSTWLLRNGEKFNYQASDVGKDAWLVSAIGHYRNIDLMNEFKPNIVMLEVVERNILTLADLPLPPETPVGSANVTDENWVNGVARNWAGFFVTSSTEAIKKYAVGSMVQFADGQKRRIVRAEQNGVYLNVFVSGTPLDGNKVGYPKAVDVLKSTSHK